MFWLPTAEKLKLHLSLLINMSRATLKVAYEETYVSRNYKMYS